MRRLLLETGGGLVLAACLAACSDSGSGGGGSRDEDAGAGGSAGAGDGAGGQDGGAPGAGGAPAGGASAGGAAPCHPAIVPAAPAASSVVTPGGNLSFVAVEVSVDFGDSPAGGAVPATRYLEVGYDRDGACTAAGSAKEAHACALPADAAKVPEDGPGGVDNAFGAIVQQTRELLSDFSSENAVAGLKTGTGGNLILRVSAYNGEPNDDQVRLEATTAAPFDAFEPGAVPEWKGKDYWPVNDSTLTDSDREKPKFFDDAAYVTKGKLVAKLDRLSVTLGVALGALGAPDLRLTVQNAELSCTVAETDVGESGFTLNGCTLGGSLLADDLLHQLGQLPDPLAVPDAHPMCLGGASYKSFKRSICNSVDLLNAGAPPSGPCDALSVGVAFDMEPGELGNVFTDDPGQGPCPAAADPATDSCGAP